MLMAHVERYVALQRSLGLRFDQQERLLVLYARFASSAGDTFVTTQRIHAWSSGASSPGQARARYDTVRKFATFLKAENGRHEVPPAGAFGRGKRQRPAPYLLKPSEIAAIMAAALSLPPQETVSPLTYHHLFGLLAATGLRISEALALRRDDLTDDGLVVRRGKFDKCRLVPLHPSTRVALGRYLAARDRFGAGATTYSWSGMAEPPPRRACTASSFASPARSASVARPVCVGRACMISGIPSQSGRSKPAHPTAGL